MIWTRLDGASAFKKLQSTLIEAAWAPEKNLAALDMLRRWLSHGLDGKSCPFLVKQFAAHFAIWHKEVSGTEDGAGLAFQLAATSDVDDIVHHHVSELISTAARTHVECLGRSVEFIAEHTSVLTVERRLSSFVELLFGLGRTDVKATDTPGDGERKFQLRQEALKRSLWVFWGRFPENAFALIATMVRHVLRLSEVSSQDELPDVGAIGVNTGVSTSELEVALQCIVLFWDVVRHKVREDSGTAVQALEGLVDLLGEPVTQAPETHRDVEHFVLKLFIHPLLTDALLSLLVKDPESAHAMLLHLKASDLWQYTFDSVDFKESARLLEEVGWYFALFDMHAAAGLANAREVNVSGEADRCVARGSLLDWAIGRMERDRPLFQLEQFACTLLSEELWDNLRSTIACRVLFLLLGVFEQDGDFDGSMEVLAVAVANSPWVLKALKPKHVRTFLSRLALIPQGV